MTRRDVVEAHAAFFAKLGAMAPKIFYVNARDEDGELTDDGDDDVEGVEGGGGASVVGVARDDLGVENDDDDDEGEKMKTKKRAGKRAKFAIGETKTSEKGAKEEEDAEAMETRARDGRERAGKDVREEMPRRRKDDQEDDGVDARGGGSKASGESALEALRERLRMKIENSRKERKAAATAETARDAKEWREARNKAKQEKKRKANASATLSEARLGVKRVKGEDGGAKGEMQFGRVTVEDDGLNSGRKKKKDSKDVLLRKVLERKKAIEDAGGELGGGKAVADKYAWEAALSRASGEKVLDDPKLLNKSIKREERAKKKSRAQWEERTQKVKEQISAAQKVRKDNIKQRKDAKIERRMDKRENKRRPGFEGRSGGFINKA